MKMSLSRSLPIASLIILAAFVPKPGRAQKADPRAGLLVTTEWLGQHLRDPNLVLLHVGDRKEYDEAHIPGARYVSLDDIADSDHSTPGALMLQVLSTEGLREKLSGLGISNSSRVVVYYGNDWVTPATRVVFTLDYAGLGDRASLLDGGMVSWKKEKRPLTSDIPAARTGSLAPLVTKPIIVDGAWVKSNIGKPGISVVDGRAAAFYDGVETGRGMHAPHRTGHIAGAKSIPYTEITDEKLKLKSPAALAAIFARAGVKIGRAHV